MKAKKKTTKRARSAATGRFVIGREAFDRISAVEDMNLNPEMKRTFQKLDKQKLSPEQRRKVLAGKYGRP
jgi:hypothetical protein